MQVEDEDGKGTALDPKLLELLVCPLTKGSLRWDAENSELISKSAKLASDVALSQPLI